MTTPATLVSTVALAMLMPAMASAQIPSISGTWIASDEKGGRGKTIEIQQEGTRIVYREGTRDLDGTFIDGRLEIKFVPTRVEHMDVGGDPRCSELKLRMNAQQADPDFRLHYDLRLDQNAQTFSGTQLSAAIHCRVSFGEVSYEGLTRLGPKPLFLRRPGCDDISGSVTLGQGNFSLNVALNETLKRLEEDKDPDRRDNLCHYVAVGAGTAALRAGGFAGASGDMSIAPSIPNLDISLYQLPGNPGDSTLLREIELTWNDSEADTIVVLDRFGVKFKLYSVSVTFTQDDAGAVQLKEGAVALQMVAEGDLQLRGPVYLGGDLSTLFIYQWAGGATDWSQGTWSVEGNGNLRLEVKHDGQLPLAVADVSYDSVTGIAAGSFRIASSAEFQMSGFAVGLKNVALGGELNLRTGEWRITGAGLNGYIRARRPIAGDIAFTLGWNGDHFNLEIASNAPMTAFGVTCENLRLSVDLNRETLAFREIRGLLGLKHRDFDAALAIESIVIRDGELITFLGRGNVSFNNFRLDVDRVSYDARVRPAFLDFSARMALGWSGGDADITVSNLKIDETGEVSSFGISAAFANAPIDLSFAATYDKARARFAGRFSGKFAGTSALAGTVLVGAQPAPGQFSYGYLTLEFNFSRGIPLGQSGLVLVGLNGAVGFNFVPAPVPPTNLAADRRREPDGRPENGSYYFLGGLTIGDVAGLASLRSEFELQLGVTTAVGLRGTVQVTRGTPYFIGSVSARYALGSGAVTGDLAAAVRVPSSGSIVTINNNILTYSVGNGQWSVRGVELGGSFFSFLDISRGSLRLNGTLADPVSSMTGRLQATISGGGRATWGYPTKYAPWGDGSGRQCSAVRSGALTLDCGCSDGSDDAAGIGFAGGFAAGLAGDIDVTLDSTGAPGRFALEATLSGSVALTTPVSGWFGSACAQVQSVTARGRVDAVNSNEYLDVNGTLAFETADGWSASLPFSYRF